MTRLLTIVGWSCLIVSTVCGDETAGWRGDGTATFDQCQPPLNWASDSGNVVWKQELGRGYSSPVYFGNKIFATASPSEIFCFDAETGLQLWSFSANYEYVLGEAKAKEIAEKYKQLDQVRRDAGRAYDQLRKSDPDSPKLEELKEKRKEADNKRKEFEREYPREQRGGAGNCAATPLCDGEKVYALFGTGTVVALTLDGKPVWKRRLEVPQQGFGHSASPVMADAKLILHINQMYALDPKNGKTIWQSNVPAKFGSAVVAKIGNEQVIVTPSGCVVDAKDGKVLAEKQFRLSHNSPLIHDNIVYAHESGKVKAFRLPGSVDETFELEKLWETSATSDQRMATALYHDGLLYACGRKGIIDVTDAKTGKLVYRERGKIGEVFSSPVMAGGMIFLSGKNGQTLVFQKGRKFKEIAQNQLGRIGSLPVFHQKRMYLRTDKFLYCIGE